MLHKFFTVWYRITSDHTYNDEQAAWVRNTPIVRTIAQRIDQWYDNHYLVEEG